ncbi:multiple cyclophane-containing RiPP AmcA [Micromonospora sp. NPDC049523]|uniref:multiple cyclophane-containing RiPP AmcA n=1 Tax=Micromonospora sp. NPDC049523 TaxID=3155921 RepID=UPI00341843C3
MLEITSPPDAEPAGGAVPDPVADRVRAARSGLTTLLQEAEQARRERAEAAAVGESGGAVCAWNHFENIPTFYNWNNRPR